MICCARRKALLDEIVAELPGEGHLSIAFDALCEEEVAAAGSTLKSLNRTLHGAVMCAGNICYVLCKFPKQATLKNAGGKRAVDASFHKDDDSDGGKRGRLDCVAVLRGSVDW